MRGSYPAPTGPDWGWRIRLSLRDPAALAVVMHNITPDGQGEAASDARYARA